MQCEAAPSFDEWVNYCFTQGYPDFHTEYGSPGYEVVEARTEKFIQLDPAVLATFIPKLFRSPEFLADRYTDDQIGDALWFLFGIASEYFKTLRSKGVPSDLQIEAFSSVTTLYTELLDRVCCKRGTDPDGRYTNELKVDIAVYMIWDMDCIEGAVMFPRETPHLVDPGFAVLETVLTHCRTSSCLISALHGLGHLQMYHQQRVQQMIDGFLASHQIPTWVRQYATQARAGCIL